MGGILSIWLALAFVSISQVEAFSISIHPTSSSVSVYSSPSTAVATRVLSVTNVSIIAVIPSLILLTTEVLQYKTSALQYSPSKSAYPEQASQSLNIISPTSVYSVGVPASSATIQLKKTNITCEENYMEIIVDKYRYPHLEPTDFHLQNTSCKSTVNGRYIKLRTPLNGCGTTAEHKEDAIVYANYVKAYKTTKDSADLNATITRKDSLKLPFNCTYNRTKIVSSTSYTPKRRVDASEGSFGKFTFIMDLYRTNSYTTKYSPGDYPISVKLNDPIFVQYQVKSTQADLNVFAERCLATTTKNENSEPNYVFLDDGCAKDDTMVYNYSPYRVQNFTINAFRFIADHPIVYLHCMLMVCHNNASTSKCAKGCDRGKAYRARREPQIERGQESKLYHLFSGALTLKKLDSKITVSDEAPLKTSTTVIVLSSVVGVLLVGCLVLMSLLRRKRRIPEPKPAQELQVYEYPVTEDD